jgi:uncharacterized protein involved in exopolysaccharide biosynthesis
VGGVAALTWREPGPAQSYQAFATIVVEPVAAPSVLGSLPSGLGLVAGSANLNTQIQLLNSRNVMERAWRKLLPETDNLTLSITVAQIEALQRSISIRLIPNTNFLEIRARASTPELAERQANAVVEAYIDYIKDDRTRAIQEALNDVNAQLESPVQSQDVGSAALDLLPGLGIELTDIARTVEESSEKLAQLQHQDRTSVSTQRLFKKAV